MKSTDITRYQSSFQKYMILKESINYDNISRGETRIVRPQLQNR